MALPAVSGETAQVELYTVIGVCLLLVTVGLLGLLANTSLLLSAKCKRSIRNLHYALPYSLAVSCLFLGQVWLVLLVVQLVEGYHQRPLHAAICYLAPAVFHFSLTALVLSLLLVAVQRLYRLNSTKPKFMKPLIVLGLGFIWLTAIVFGLLVALSVHLERPVNYAICMNGIAHGPMDFNYSRISMVICLLLVITLILTLATAGIFVSRQQRFLVLLLLESQRERAGSENYDSKKGGKHVTMGTGSSIPAESSRKSSEAESSLSNQCFTVQETFRPSRVKSEAKQDEEEEDDDTFDMKMRLRLQKSGSGRRHTVANIGPRDTLLGGRRGSLEERRPVNTGYQYVRKWSVDIVALQNQLENPKLYQCGNAFQDMLKERGNPGDILEEDKAETTESAESGKEREIEETDEETEEVTEEEEREETKVPMLNKSEDEIDELNTTDPFTWPEAQQAMLNGSKRSRPSKSSESGLEGRVQQLKKELERCSKVLVMLSVGLLCLLPYMVLQFLQGGPISISTDRNLSHLMSAVCILQCPLHPLLLAWMDPRLSSALSRLRVKLTHWRCVCYCNIGKGKPCFKNIHQESGSEQVAEA